MELLILPPANKKDAWVLPAGGSAYDDTWLGGACKTVILCRYKGCLNVDAHNQVTLDGIDTSNKVYVKPVRRNCGRFECPICYETWVAKSAKRIEYRMLEYSKMRIKVWKGYKLYPKHVTVSPPEKEHGKIELKMSHYKGKIHLMLKRVGVHGGTVIYHPSRWRCWECGSERKMGKKTCYKCNSGNFERYFSPHFHILGVGFVDGKEVKRNFLEIGYVIKNINGGKRSIFRTAQYQLSHCGKKKGGRAFTWFGTLSYLKFKTKKFKDEGEPCPICGSIMIPLKYLGGKEEPLEGLAEYKRGCLDRPGNWGSVTSGLPPPWG